MPIGKNSLARAAKQVSATKHKDPLEETVPQTPLKAIPLEVLSEKVPADETSRPAISPVSAVNVTPDHLPAIDVSDSLATEAATPKKRKASAGKPASKKSSKNTSKASTKTSAKSSAKVAEHPAEPTVATPVAEATTATAEVTAPSGTYALGDDLPYYLL